MFLYRKEDIETALEITEEDYMGKIVALLGTEQAEIPLNKIVEDPFLPRKSYSPEGLVQLAEAIRAQKLMHAIVVTRRSDDCFGLILGSRRVRAARAAGYTHIPGTIADVKHPRDIVLLALAENVQREDLDPVEEANAYLLLCQEYGLSIKEVAKRIGKSTGHIRDRIKLLDLAPAVQQLVVDDGLSPSAAVKLVGIPSGEEQLSLANEIVRNNLTHHEARALIKEDGARPVESRGRTREMSVQKYRLSIVNFGEEMLRNFSSIEKLAMTAEERGRLTRVQLALESASKSIRDRISAGGRVVFSESLRTDRRGNMPTARNHGDVWPTVHLKLLENRSLSDEDIAAQTGREITAVQSMRRAHSKKRR